MPPSHSSNSAEHRTGTKDALGAGEGRTRFPARRTMDEGAGAARSAWARRGAGPWGGRISFGESQTTPFLQTDSCHSLIFFPKGYSLKLGEVK